jgi:hypothetical protein
LNTDILQAFQKVESANPDDKRGFMWRLTEAAVHQGVKSTTRYRAKLPSKRSSRGHHAAPQRKASGSKGGLATRTALAKYRRSERRKEQMPLAPTSSGEYSNWGIEGPAEIAGPRKPNFFDPASDLDEVSDLRSLESSYFFSGPMYSTNPDGNATVDHAYLTAEDSGILPAPTPRHPPCTTHADLANLSPPISFKYEDVSLPTTPTVGGGEYGRSINVPPSGPALYMESPDSHGPTTPPDFADFEVGSNVFVDTNVVM